MAASTDSSASVRKNPGLPLGMTMKGGFFVSLMLLLASVFVAGTDIFQEATWDRDQGYNLKTRRHFERSFGVFTKRSRENSRWAVADSSGGRDTHPGFRLQFLPE